MVSTPNTIKGMNTHNQLHVILPSSLTLQARQLVVI